MFSKIKYDLSEKLSPYLLTKSDSQKLDKESQKKKKFNNTRNKKTFDFVEEQEFLIGLGGAFWSSVLEYSSQNNLTSPSDWELLSRATQFPKRLLDTDKEYKKLSTLLKRARKLGFRH